MTDKDKTLVEEPTEESKADDKPITDVKSVEEPKAEETKTEESDSGTATSIDDVATPAGTDQQGRQLYIVKCANCGK